MTEATYQCLKGGSPGRFVGESEELCELRTNREREAPERPCGGAGIVVLMKRARISGRAIPGLETRLPLGKAWERPFVSGPVLQG